MSSSSLPNPAPRLRKPRMRGVLHQWAAVAAFGAGLVLTVMAPPGRATVGAAVFSCALTLLFAVSATYHRPTWGFRWRRWLRRADHAAIYVLIAGTYTPVCLLRLPDESGSLLLKLAWGGALLGFIQALFWPDVSKWLGALLGLLMGWCAVLFARPLIASLTTLELVLLAAGGLAYTAGAVSYAMRWPNPRPATFGYHEIFHAFTIVAAVLHFAAVVSLVESPAEAASAVSSVGPA